MFGDKDFEEIEIEQIDLDVDKSFDVTIDVSSIDNINLDLPLEETSTSQKEVKQSIEDVELQEIKDVGEELEESVSLSNEELESILESAEVKEVEEVSSTSEDIGLTLESTPKVEEELGFEGAVLGESDFSGKEGLVSGEELVKLEEEKVETNEENVVTLSTDEYNKIVEESEKVLIVDKPIEEVLEVSKEEEIEIGEVISPSDLGIEGEKVIKEEDQEVVDIEFGEVSEDMVMSKLEAGELTEEIGEVEVKPKTKEEFVDLSTSFEELEVGEGKIGSEEVTSSEFQISENVDFSLEPEEEKFELVDDISVDVESVREEPSSIMPDE
ncbi:MAG: hypothetical protein ACP5KI_03665, partial [Brevinematia bacterium]